MIEDGRLLLIDCLEALSADADFPPSLHELLESVLKQPDLGSHLWCEHGCLIGDVLEALPPSLYEHEASLSLLTVLEEEVVGCVRCLQAYHTAQVGVAVPLSTIQGFAAHMPVLNDLTRHACSRSACGGGKAEMRCSRMSGGAMK